LSKVSYLYNNTLQKTFKALNYLTIIFKSIFKNMPNFFSKLFLKKDKQQKSEKPQGFLKRWSSRMEMFSSFIKKNIKKTKSTITESRSRLSNLEKSNYDIGRYHLRRGHIWDATFRFKLMNKFWPEYKDAKYYLAYCLAIKGKYEDAKKFINEFLGSNPNHKKAKELHNALENEKMEEFIKKYTKELEENAKKV